jgi:hypothetical protein
MSSPIVVRFPPRSAHCIWLLPETDGAWTVVAGNHGWVHSDYRAAHEDAAWLSRNFDLPVRLANAAQTLRSA